MADDDNAIRTTLQLLFVDAGYTVFVAPEASPLLSGYESACTAWWLCWMRICQVNMPSVDGVQVMRAIAAHAPLATRHAYVLVTASGELDSAAAAANYFHAV